MACASYDSGVRFHMSKQTFLSIHYQDPSDPKSKPVIVDLPPLPKGSQIQSLDMSSRPDLNNKDWVVAVKYSGSQLRLYRPACHDDSQWIDIKTTPASINPFSSLMYSKKDKRFYIPTPGGEYWCSLHLHFKKGNHPKFNTTWNVNIPRSLMHEYLHELDSFLRTDHLVESPSGEKFLVKWYSGDSFKNINGVMTFEHITKRFMVFRTDDPKKEFKVLSYTDNIGDLCIFLGHGEALCVPASSSPGLKPNCIYFVGYTFGVYDIATRLCTTFITNEGVLKSTEFPYWPSPIPLYS
ncbi:PREDICTED: uncharacterized protein LOC104733296 [Camelina sativa]|uniref:Uncharacterized protein LOC104733296 n=1 Tax=Camelina sativa TaxID=90675 RepID=A0ABM0V5Q1_CAMSA|nr:PREDICTED: uncharacterized protein LOC104733296 [Camelina sativa]